MRRLIALTLSLAAGWTPAVLSAAPAPAPAPVAVHAASLSAPSLRLGSVPNFRDIGGYRTRDGHVVRTGLAYRSDQLDRIADADLATLAGLRGLVVADLRTGTERAREPDRLPPGARHVILDVAADSSKSLGGDMRLAMAQIARGEGQALLVAANREFVSLPSARRSYAALIRLMLAPGGPVIYHCTAGKDRTGWATAVVLMLLGVPRETVMRDYLLSNERLAAKNRAILASLAQSGAAIDPAFLEPVLTVRPEYIAAAFAEVARRYGSFDGYARDGLGLRASEVRQLRAKFLVPANVGG